MVFAIQHRVKFRRDRTLVIALIVALAVFWLGFDGGAYGLESRTILAIALWWTVIVAVGLGLWPLARLTRAGLVTGGLLLAFALLAAASMIWAASAERAFVEFNRAILYVGVYAAAVLGATRANAARWSDGIAIGIGSIGVLALLSRLFPDVLGGGDAYRFLPAAYLRLSYPVGYWNGLAILLALGTPFLLRSAVTADRSLWRALAVAALPVFAASIFLTSSRGGVAAAVVAILAFVALADRRLVAAAGVVVAGVGSAAAIAVLLARPELVNGPLESDAAVAQGRSAAVLIALVCILTGIFYAVSSRYAGRRLSLPPLLPRVAIVVLVLLSLAGIAAANPMQKFEEFKEAPPALTGKSPDFVRAHLLSGNGSGRWQFWASAVDEFESRPLLGGGAGSYEAWWAQHGTLATFIRNAHSLYLETLAELGVVGFVLLTGALAVGIVTGVRRLVRSRGEERILLAAFLAAFLAYAVAAGVDWMWELTVVSVVGFVCLALLTGAATAPAATLRLGVGAAHERARPRRRFVVGAAALAVGWLFICAQAIPLLAAIKVRDSQAAVRRGDARAALEDAEAARNLQPWAASPYLQLALVEEQTESLSSALASISEAIERDPEDWRLHLISARLHTKAGEIAAARRSLRRAIELNPRSPLFARARS